MSAPTLYLYRSLIAPMGTSRKSGVDFFDYLIFLPSIWIPAALGLSLRLIGPLFVVVPIASCILYAALRRAPPPRLLTALILYCIVVAGLSEYQLFPASWQIYFFQDAIVRQLVPLVGFWAVAWASSAYFHRMLLTGRPFFGASLVLILAFVSAPLAMFKDGLLYPGDGPLRSMFTLYGAFINNIVIGMFFLLGYVFLSKGWRRGAAIALFLAIFAATQFLQFRIFALLVLALLLGFPSRLLLAGLIAAFVCVYAIGLHYIPEMMLASPDSGIRLAFIKDALSSVVDSHGLGIGYGTESVRWVYHFPSMPVFRFLPDPARMTHARMLEALSTGVHNSFIQALLRTGVIGFALFTAAFFAVFPRASLPRLVRSHACVVFALIFLACFVNPALESPAQAVGVGLVYGYLFALKRCFVGTLQTKAVPVEISPSPLSLGLQPST